MVQQQDSPPGRTPLHADVTLGDEPSDSISGDRQRALTITAVSSPSADAWRRFRHNWAALISLTVIVAAVIIGLQYLLNRTKLGLAIRAVAQDEETARTMGINFTAVVLVTFALGSALAAFAGIMNGLYYNEINFGMGLYLGVIGFSAAIIGGLGSIYGAILGGFLFAGLQTIGTVLLPFASAYKDVFAFAVVIAIMAWRPTGLIREKISERV